MTDTTDPHLTIGAFARASRLSLKALRLYDELHLLPPARTDHLTGYRYYTPDQLDRAQLIGLLRQLGLPLSAVRAVLDAPAPARAAHLHQLWSEQEVEHGRRRALARYLTEKLQGDTTMTHYEIQERFVPAQQVATLARRVYVADLPAFIEEAGTTLTDLTGPHTSGAAIVIYHGEVNADSDGPVEVCVPYRGELTAPPEVTLREEPAHHEAFVPLTRDQFEFPEILRAYDATRQYVQEHGQCTALSPREVYPVRWAGLPGNAFAGDVALPFEPRR